MRSRAARSRRRSSGVVLLLTLVVLAVLAIVAGRYVERMDRARERVVGLQQMADATARAQATQATLAYWVATRALRNAGHGEAGLELKEDGRWYRSADSTVFFSVRDHRGLLPANSLEREELLRVFAPFGLQGPRADTLVDVLQDYLDTDDLKRLNGAERREYEALGKPPPRNDWLVSVQEMAQLPHWQDEPALLSELPEIFSPSTLRLFNPLTASVPVLRARLPGMTDEQLQRLLTLRAESVLVDGPTAARFTGLALDRDDFIFAPGPEKRILVWAPGLPRMHEYNVRLSTGGVLGPWLVTEFSFAPRRLIRNDLPTFPLPGLAGRPEQVVAGRPAAP